MRWHGPTALLLLLGLALPAAARGHSLVRSGGGLVSYVSADATSLNTLLVREGTGRLEFRDESVDGGLDPGSCSPGDLGAESVIVQVYCPLEGVRRVRIDLGDREDRATVSLGLPVTLLGGTGADTLVGGSAADELAGGEGNDLVSGGAGDDVLSGDPGTDGLDGGDGADRILARDGEADSITCGPGADTADADGLDTVHADCEGVMRTDTSPAPASGAADDGRPPEVDAGAPTFQRLGRARVVRVYATISERGTLGASGSLEASGLVLPVKRLASRRVDVAGGGAELTYTLRGRHWRVARRALRRETPVLVRLGVVGTDLAGQTRRRDAPAIRIVRGVETRTASGLRATMTHAAHPEPGDVDGDEVRDEVDNCPLVRNGSQVNTDRASEPAPGVPGTTVLGDACDEDDDADGVPDAQPDNCRVVANPDQSDSDRDGYGDACPPVDDDGDRLINADDNCDLVANPDQADLDGDDRGDACDRDRDGDRFDDAYDNCPTVYNIEASDVNGDGLVNDQLDADRDGIGTACDPDEPLIQGSPPPPPAPPPLGAPDPPDRSGPRLRMTVARRYRMAEIRAGLVVRLNCSEPCATTAELSLVGSAARRLGASRVVASGSARLGGSGATYAFVRFTRPIRRALRGRAVLRTSLTAIAVDPAGNRRMLTRRIALRR